MLDHQGNCVHTVINRKENAHILSVNRISVDSRGEQIATCSDDGKVIISGLYTDENNQVLSTGKIIKAVELDPNHNRSGSGKRFIIGKHRLGVWKISRNSVINTSSPLFFFCRQAITNW